MAGNRNKRALPFDRLPGPAAKLSIHSGSSLFSLAARPASHLTQPGRHPRFGSQKALQQAGYVEIRIQRWKVEAEARWTDFFELGSLRALQIFRAPVGLFEIDHAMP
jgi:hypothetical protein